MASSRRPEACRASATRRRWLVVSACSRARAKLPAATAIWNTRSRSAESDGSSVAASASVVAGGGHVIACNLLVGQRQEVFASFDRLSLRDGQRRGMSQRVLVGRLDREDLLVGVEGLFEFALEAPGIGNRREAPGGASRRCARAGAVARAAAPCRGRPAVRRREGYRPRWPPAACRPEEAFLRP